jgi:hypothetical protein
MRRHTSLNIKCVSFRGWMLSTPPSTPRAAATVGALGPLGYNETRSNLLVSPARVLGIQGSLGKVATVMVVTFLEGSPVAKTSLRPSGEKTGWLAFSA